MTVEYSPSRNWRLNKERYSLIGEVCLDCEEAIFPPRDICPYCGGQRCEQHQFSGRGELYSITTVRHASSEHQENTPYKLALIKLEDGPLITAQLTDLDPHVEITIGTQLEMVTRVLSRQGNRGQIIYGYKFRPILKSS